MKPEQFIREQGLDKAREVVEGAPESGQPLYFNTTNKVYLFTGYRNTYFVNGVWGTEDDHPSMQDQTFKAVSITHLKRLVESVDRINASGGIYGFKTYCNGDYQEQDLADIRNYESIYGEGNE